MKIARFIANRIAQSKQKSFSRFILRLSFTATALSVAIMIITMALATGFQKAIEDKILGFWGHVRIQEKQADKSVRVREIPLLRNADFESRLLTHPNIKSVHPFANQYALLKTKSSLEGVLIKGIDTGGILTSNLSKVVDSPYSILFLFQGKFCFPHTTLTDWKFIPVIPLCYTLHKLAKLPGHARCILLAYTKQV